MQVPPRVPPPRPVPFQRIILPLMEPVTLPTVFNSPMTRHSNPVILTVAVNLDWAGVAACVRALPNDGITGSAAVDQLPVAFS